MNQVRKKTIEELRKAQKDSLEYYKLNSSHIKAKLTEEKNIDQLKSELFAEKFYFQIHLTKKRLWPFTLFTFATDFYMSSSDINTLEYDIFITISFIFTKFNSIIYERKFINAEEKFFGPNCTPVFDEVILRIYNRIYNNPYKNQLIFLFILENGFNLCIV